jgi:hypothetical protein
MDEKRPGPFLTGIYLANYVLKVNSTPADLLIRPLNKLILKVISHQAARWCGAIRIDPGFFWNGAL